LIPGRAVSSAVVWSLLLVRGYSILIGKVVKMRMIDFKRGELARYARYWQEEIGLGTC